LSELLAFSLPPVFPCQETTERKYIVDIVDDLPTIIMETYPLDIDSAGLMAIKKIYYYGNDNRLKGKSQNCGSHSRPKMEDNLFTHPKA
jgi:hypothetical protein